MTGVGLYVSQTYSGVSVATLPSCNTSVFDRVRYSFDLPSVNMNVALKQVGVEQRHNFQQHITKISAGVLQKTVFIISTAEWCS